MEFVKDTTQTKDGVHIEGEYEGERIFHDFYWCDEEMKELKEEDCYVYSYISKELNLKVYYKVYHDPMESYEEVRQFIKFEVL